MSSSSDMPAVETFVEAGAVVEAGRLGAGARGVAAIADVAGGADVLGAGAAGRAWAIGVAPLGGSFFVERCGVSDCGATARVGEANANGITERVGDATGARGAGMISAGETTAATAETGGATGAVAFGDVGADAGPSRNRVRACPGSVVAIKAPIVTVASQAMATPNHPSPLERRTSGAPVNAKGAAASGSNAGARGDQCLARGQVGCAALATETRRASDRVRRMTSSSVSA
jgi:hypothetical protein